MLLYHDMIILRKYHFCLKSTKKNFINYSEMGDLSLTCEKCIIIHTVCGQPTIFNFIAS